MSSAPASNPVLQIDPEFESKIPPLTTEEFHQLEDNIVSDGMVLMPLIVWNGVIVDGHNRYKVIQSHPEIRFSVHELAFDNRYEALAWICKNQLGRRNLTPEQKKYLIGQRYEAEKKAHGARDGFRGNQHLKVVTGPNSPLPGSHVTRSQIAEESGTTDSYVKYAEQYARGVDAAEEAMPGIKQDLLSGKLKAPHKAVAAIARAAPEERRQIMHDILHPPDKSQEKSNAADASKSGDSPDAASCATPAPAEHRLTEQGAIQQFEWKVTLILQDFDSIFDEWPQLISEEIYRRQVRKTLEDLKQYILHIEGGTRFDWDYEARKII